MYGLVLLAALSASEGAVGYHRGYPTPNHTCPGCHPGYHNHGGWGLPYGGYGWPGYAGWGGCGGYASPAYGVPMSPIVTPAPPYAYEADPDDEKDKDKDKENGKAKNKDKDKDNGKKKKDSDGDDEKEKKGKPKKDSDNDTTANRARLTFLLPAGAKLTVDGREVKAESGKMFQTPALEQGEMYYYEVTAEVMRDGKPVSETRRLTLKAGTSVRADFRKLGDTAVTSTK